MKYGISIAVFPTAWEIGYARIRNKDVVAFGPFRFSLHRIKGALKDYPR
jgi:hypothetical protein